MSYNFQENCRPRVPHFSNPDISYRGTPTGDERLRHKRPGDQRDAFHVANFRTKLPPAALHSLVMSADDAARQGFLRIINRLASSRYGAHRRNRR